MRRISFFATVALAACASSGATDPANAPARILSSGDGYDIQVGGDTERSTMRIAASPDDAWRALPEVFQALEIPVENIDSGRRTLGNRQHSVRRRLAGKALAQYLNCGSSMTGPIASSHEIQLSVLAQVLPGEGGASRLQTRVEGSARSPQGASVASVHCGTTGRLETRIAELLNRRVAG